MITIILLADMTERKLHDNYDPDVLLFMSHPTFRKLLHWVADNASDSLIESHCIDVRVQRDLPDGEIHFVPRDQVQEWFLPNYRGAPR